MLFSLSVPVDAQQQDVTFFVIGKHANFDQFPDGSLKPVDFSFFSEIFFTENGDAQDAFMNMPTSERIRFRDQRLVEGPDKDNLLLISGAKRFSSYAELLSWYPDGVYEIEFDTPSGSVSNVELEFPVNGLPNPPNISLYQDGKPVCGVVDPDKALEVRWSEFTQGGADENGILDDLIFAILEDETGRRVSHSGRPFEGKPYLTYVNTLHTIDAAAMQDKKEYTLSVEHAVLTDTSKFDSVPAMTTYAVTTRLKFRTGTVSGTDCSAESREENIDMGLTTDAQVVMFYYKDLTDADHFYGDILGLEKTLDEDWVKFYKTSANATVGLVAESEGAWHQAQEKNAVMLSIVTSEVDAWYEMLRQKEGVSFLKEIGDGGPIRSFLIEDPGGYTVEFFEWLEAGNQ
jgi:extradiol dioxygenase family protein